MFIVFILAMVILIAAFSVQNMTAISVSLLLWRFETTLLMLVCIAVLFGVIVSQLVRQLMAKRAAPVVKT